jgi:hypothetical protein
VAAALLVRVAKGIHNLQAVTQRVTRRQSSGGEALA